MSTVSGRWFAPPRRWLAVWGCLLGACAPDTDLIGEEAGPGDSNGQVTAAAAALVDPAPGAGAVPPNLAAVLIRFPRALSVLGGALPDGILTIGDRDSGSDGGTGGGLVGTGPAVVVACPADADGACFRCALVESLRPSATYVVTLAAGLVDADGRPLGAGPVGQFVTAAEADDTPPEITGFAVEPSGPCVLVNFQTDEPAVASLVMRAAEFERNIPAGAGTTRFAFAASLAAFGAGNGIELRGRAEDRAGNVAETAAVSVMVPLGLLPLTITEVQANAVGPEPAQEYVELRNLGTNPVDVGGLVIEDGKGTDNLPVATIDAGAYALVVPAGFQADSVVDTPPKPGTLLIRVDARLGWDGLANGGEMVRLRNDAGIVVSSYGGSVDTSAAKWAGKGVHRMPEDGCDQPAGWSRLPVAATPGWGPP